VVGAKNIYGNPMNKGIRSNGGNNAKENGGAK